MAKTKHFGPLAAAAGAPENVSLLALPPYSPELNPVERWFQEFRRAISNRIFETVAPGKEGPKGLLISLRCTNDLCA
jgi:transposase